MFDRGCGEGYLITRLICDPSGANHLKATPMPGLVPGFVYLVTPSPFIPITDRIVGSEIFAAMFWERKELRFVLSRRNHSKSSCYRVGISAAIRAFGYGLRAPNSCF